MTRQTVERRDRHRGWGRAATREEEEEEEVVSEREGGRGRSPDLALPRG